MAAYKKIQGNPIRPSGGKPGMNRNGLHGHPKSGVSVKGSVRTVSTGRDGFMGTQASGSTKIKTSLHA